MPDEVKLLPCEELVESVKQSLEDVFYDTLNCAFDADLLARAAIEAMSRPTTVVTDEVVERDDLDKLCAEVEADAVAGLRYIERHYGRLEGVGWDRVFDAHDKLFERAAAIDSMPTVVTGEQRDA